MDAQQKKFVFFLILAVVVGMLVAIKWLQNTEVENVSLEDQTRVYQAKEPIDAMLEVKAGWVKRQGVKIGDEVVK